MRRRARNLLATCALGALGAAGPGCGDGASRAGESLPEGPEVVLAGRVLDARGAPLAGVSVDATSEREGRDEPARVQVWTDERGAFRIDSLPFGVVVVSADSFPRRPAELALGYVGPIDAREGLELTLPDGPELGGRVLHPDGTPAPAVAVWVESDGGWEYQRCTSDAQGAFLVRGLADGPCRVTAIARAERPDEVELATARGVPAGMRALELVLRRTGALEVVVRGTAAPEQAYTTVLDLEGQRAATPLNGGNSEMRASFPEGRLEPGAYWLEVSDDEHALAARRRVEVEEGRTRRVELELAPATRLAVRALADGVPVDFDLALHGPDGFVDRTGYRTCVVVDGSIERLLPPGAYRVEARTEEGFASAELTLAGEPARRLELELE